MRKTATIFILLISAFTLSAQQLCDCRSELDFVYEQIQDAASFKSQIKGETLTAFEKEYQQMRASFSEEVDLIKCFWQLNQLLGKVKDKHMSVYGTRPDFSVKEARDSAFVAEYRKSETFINHPVYDKDLETLKASLATKAIGDVEGIYNIGSAMKLGVFKSSTKGEYMGVILESNLGVWEAGQFMLYMTATERSNEYDIMTYGQVQKHLLFYKAQVYQFGHLFGNGVKEGITNTYSRIDRENTTPYQLTQINKEVQYFWLDALGRYEKEAQRDALITQINKELTAPNLIVDMRDNGGGASKISIPILRALKKKSTKIYVLTNFFSASNAEQTTVRLKKIKGTVHLGQRTYGAIAYGKNYGRSYQSPSGLFTFSPTDMKFNHFLKYEEVGVAPDIELDNASDWVDQTINIINAQNLKPY